MGKIIVQIPDLFEPDHACSPFEIDNDIKCTSCGNFIKDDQVVYENNGSYQHALC